MILRVRDQVRLQLRDRGRHSHPPELLDLQIRVWAQQNHQAFSLLAFSQVDEAPSSARRTHGAGASRVADEQGFTGPGGAHAGGTVHDRPRPARSRR